MDTGCVSYLGCVRIARRSIRAQLAATARTRARAVTDAVQGVRRRLLSPRASRKYPRAIKKPPRWPVQRTRADRDKAERSR